MGASVKSFGKTAGGKAVSLFTLTNNNGMSAKISNFGGIITELMVPDRHGRSADVVLGYDTVAGYESNRDFFGALIGRLGNRLAGGRFMLDGKEYQLAINEAPDRDNHLHGGTVGFDRVVWDAEIEEMIDGAVLTLSYLSPDGEEGYPGNLMVKAIYTLNDRNELKLQFEATTDAPTVINLTAHSYFNLAGHDAGTVNDHVLKINASRFTPVNTEFVPTGEIRAVKNTPLDFTNAKPIGRDLEQKCTQLTNGLGYDHNFIIDRSKGGSTEIAAEVYEPGSGRVMEVLTTQPAIQFYGGNFLDGGIGKNGARYCYRGALCLEPQHYPDAPHHGHFPSVELRPGQKYREQIIYRFSVR